MNDGTYYSAETGLKPALQQSGFWVAKTNNPLPNASERDVRILVDSLTLDEGYDYVGIWTDHQDDVIYVDGVDWYADKAEAIKAGIDNNQQAIWDIEASEEIYL